MTSSLSNLLTYGDLPSPQTAEDMRNVLLQNEQFKHMLKHMTEVLEDIRRKG